MDPRHIAKCMITVFKSRTPDTCVGANGGFKHTASFMEACSSTQARTARSRSACSRRRTTKTSPQTAALYHAIITLTDKAATLAQSDDKPRGCVRRRRRARRRLG